jgi:dienelactone hydrolase
MIKSLLFSSLLAYAYAQDRLAPPTGPYGVAHQVISLTDESRWEREAPEDSPHKRRFAASLLVPLDPASCELEAVPYLSPALVGVYGQLAQLYGLSADALDGYEIEYCTPAANATAIEGEVPVVIFGPGLGASRHIYAAQVRELASHGYFVISIDSPYETLLVEFPDGSYVIGDGGESDPSRAPVRSQTRADDVKYILNNIDTIVADLPLSVDTTKVLQYGHSMGGNTAALTAYQDERILGALNLDGALWGPLQEVNLDTPYVWLVTEALTAPPSGEFPSLEEMWERITGPRLLAHLNGTVHNSYTDLSLLFDVRPVPPELNAMKEAFVGSVAGERVIEVVSTAVISLARYVFDGHAGDLVGLGERFDDLEVMDSEIPGCA